MVIAPPCGWKKRRDVTAQDAVENLLGGGGSLQATGWLASRAAG